MTHPDYRALCAELLEALDRQAASDPEADGGLLRHRARAALAQPEPVERPIWTEGICGDGAAILRDGVMQPIEDVIAALNAAEPAQPEPVGPTDEELMTAYWQGAGLAGAGTGDHILRGLRAVLTRCSRPTLTPIPVSERLPGPEDYDSDRVCWWWNRYLTAWCLCDASQSDSIGLEWTHWLPAHALPLPMDP
jgi:hypothetical protein